MTTKLGKRLRAARIKRGLTVRDIEKLSHRAITNGYYSEIENNHTGAVSPTKLRIICDVLDLNYISVLIDAGYIKRGELK